jgi:hypothetical protein
MGSGVVLGVEVAVGVSMRGCTRVSVGVGVKVGLSVKVGANVESPGSKITTGSMTQNLVGGHASIEVAATPGCRSV